ncbi:putative SOS response-associated peptidase YedK [Bradyrhizobium sp. GM24.11]
MFSICNLYSIARSQAAILALFRVVNRYVGNLEPAPVIRNTIAGTEMTLMRWGMPATAAHGPNEVTNTNGNRYDGSSEWKQQNADCAMSPVAPESDASASPS